MYAICVATGVPEVTCTMRVLPCWLSPTVPPSAFWVPPNHFADAGRARMVNAMRVTATVRYEVREEPADARSSIRHVRGVMIAGSGR